MSFPSPKPPQCSVCQDTGVLLTEVFYSFCGLIGKKYCSCTCGNQAFKEWCQSEKVQQFLKIKRQKEVENALRFSNLPKSWKEKTLEKLEGRETIKQIINRYFDHFLEYKNAGRGIYLWSHGSGRGKTHILSAVCQELIRRYAVPSIFMTEEQVYLKIRESYHNFNSQESESLKRFKDISCLFIDDLGATKATAWKNEVLTGILDYRLNNRFPTVFTSNYSPEDYRELIIKSLTSSRPERIPSRISEICRGFIIEVKGEDWRKKHQN